MRDRAEQSGLELDPDTGVVLTQQVSREVDRQDDADGENADNDQEADDVTLEGKIVNGILSTLLPDLFVPAGGGGGLESPRRVSALSPAIQSDTHFILKMAVSHEQKP